MKLAIADPPYLGRGARWYGSGRGHYNRPRNSDVHPEADIWDSPAAHVDLVERLCQEFDGWVIAGAPDSLSVYLPACPGDTRVLVWHRGNGIPSGSRVSEQWEFVLAYVPPTRRGRGRDLPTSDVLTAGVPKMAGFTGAKPPKWTRWVLDVLGYRPDEDELTDMFPGSGAVASASDGMLALVQEPQGVSTGADS